MGDKIFYLRYDLLCLEGLARALRIFLNLEESKLFKCSPIPEDKMLTMVVDQAVSIFYYHWFHVRPHTCVNMLFVQFYEISILLFYLTILFLICKINCIMYCVLIGKFYNFRISAVSVV